MDLHNYLLKTGSSGKNELAMKNAICMHVHIRIYIYICTASERMGIYANLHA